MKTYLQKVEESKYIFCLSKNGRVCYHETNETKDCIDTKCKGKFVVFIQADPVKVVEHYERKISGMSKKLQESIPCGNMGVTR